MSDKRSTDTTNLARMFDIVRQTFPNATHVQLGTSDQGRYGFWLTDVLEGEVGFHDDPRFEGVQDVAGEFLCDLDWDSVVGEDERGYATLPMPEVEAPAVEDWELQGNYGHGWECVTGASSQDEANEYLNQYLANEPGTLFRVQRIS